MSTIKDALSKIEGFQNTPISHAPADSNKPSAVEVPDDLFDIDWSKFTIDGVYVVDLLVRAINTLVTKYNGDIEGRGTDGLTFTFQDIYKIAGIADVDVTVEVIKPEEESFASLYDKRGFGWRYYCTLKALEKFETDANWDVEIDDNGFDSEVIVGIISRYFNPLSSSYIFNFLGELPVFHDIRSIDQTELMRLTLEKVLGKYSVLMTEAEPIEIEDEDENPKESSDVKPELESLKTELRVTKPQVAITLPDILGAIGLSL